MDLKRILIVIEATDWNDIMRVEPPNIMGLDPHPSLGWGTGSAASCGAYLVGILPICQYPECYHRVIKQKWCSPFMMDAVKQLVDKVLIYNANGWAMPIVLPYMDKKRRELCFKAHDSHPQLPFKWFVDDFLSEIKDCSSYFGFLWGFESVTGNVPITIRRFEKWIDIIPIEDLVPEDGFSHYTHGFGNIEVLSRTGWTRIKKAIKLKNRKLTAYVVAGNGVTTVTEDHSIFSQGRCVKPSQLKKGDVIDTVPEVVNNSMKFPEDLAWVYGFFAAEGNCNHYFWKEGNKFGRKHRYTWEINNTDKKLLEKAGEILETYYGFPFEVVKIRETTEKHKAQYRLRPFGESPVNPRKKLAEDFECCYTKISRYKRVPYAILNARKEAKEAFIKGHFEGDGTYLDSYPRTSTTSIVLARGIEYLLHAIGKETSIYFIPKANPKWKPEIMVHILKDKPSPEVSPYALRNWKVSQNHRIGNKVKQIIWYDNRFSPSNHYQAGNPGEYVYDLETEDNTFAAGVGNILHHNSHAPHYSEKGTGDYGASLLFLDRQIGRILDNCSDAEICVASDHAKPPSRVSAATDTPNPKTLMTFIATNFKETKSWSELGISPHSAGRIRWLK